MVHAETIGINNNDLNYYFGKLLNTGMKRFMIILVLTGFFSAGFSQSYLGLSVGLTFPREKYAAKNLQENGGYALQGLMLDFSGAFVPDRFIGLAATMTFGSNVMDEDTLRQDILSLLPGPFPADAKISFNHGSWIYSNLLVGPFLTLPLDRISFDLRGMIGPSFLMSPPMDMTVITTDATYFQSRNPRAVNFAYSIGGGIRLGSAGGASIRLYAGYFRSNTSVEIRNDHIVSGQPLGKETSSYKMKITTLNVGIGLAYSL